MTSRIIVEAYNPSPGASGSITTPATVDAVAGMWTAGTYCFRVVAWYDPSGAETNIDRCGVNRSTIAAWENIVVATNDWVVLTNTRPSVGDMNLPYPYHHLSLYAQVGATPDWTQPWTKVAENTDRLDLTWSVRDDVSMATAVFNANGARVNLLPIVAPTQEPRRRVMEMAAGIPLPVPMSANTWAKRIRFGILFDSLLHSEASRLLAWENYSVHCILAETEESNAELDAPVTSWEGFFVDTPWVHRGYNVGDEPGGRGFEFWATKTTPASNLPITDPTP